MNSYILIRRLMGPSILLLLGVVALLHQAHLVHWVIFFPLLLILIGVLKLAERAALAAEPYPGAWYGDSAGQGSPGLVPAGPQPVPGAQTASLVPAETHDFGHGFGDGSDGGQL
jgi:hypothetical protein